MNSDIVVVDSNNSLWHSFNGISIDNSAQMSIVPLSNYFKLLTPNETKKVVGAFESGMFDIGLEYAWARAVRILDDRLEYFGLEFLAEMVGRDSISSLDELSMVEKINLAFELGMINSTAKMALNHANEKINHYRDREVAKREDIEFSDAFVIVKDLTKYILGNEIETSAIEFKAFRDSLKDETYTKEDKKVEELKSSPYFYIRTTIRTLLSMIKTSYKEKNLAELNKVLHNSNIFIVELWEKIFIEDRKLIGSVYSEAIADGHKEVFTTFSMLLDSVHGYDYVPETTRSNAYKKIARQYISTHYEFNNFYNEPAYAKKLDDMGTVIPDFALQDVLRAVLLSAIGNNYGVSTAAQSYNQSILKKVSIDQWKTFFAQLLVEDQELLEKLTFGNESMVQRWYETITAYTVSGFNIQNTMAKNIYENTFLKEPKKIQSEAGKALGKITGK